MCAQPGVDAVSDQLAYTIPEACRYTRIGRSSLYEAIKTRKLRAVKNGRRTLILAADLRAWIENLPAIGAKASSLDKR